MIDLEDLVPSLKREVNPPGTDLFPNATEAEWLGHLQDAFWEARLHGMLVGYTESDGLVSAIGSSSDMTRDLQQLVVLYAGFRIVLSQFRNIRSSFRAKAGPVEYETTQAATVLRDVLKAIEDKIKLVLGRLSDVGMGSATAVFDAVIERTVAIAYGEQWFVR